ncbi:hypothetical protein ACPFL9_18060 [Paenarthrobacter sp. NyZ202]|uniref:hypothetical protein n=1 Tax=Paenarthrobacter sp. NyZ202 TaxID=3402689 RepID=UPI003CEFB823
MDFTGFMPPDEFWAMQSRHDQEARKRAASLPLYQVEDWKGPLMLGSWQMDASEGSVLHGHRPPLKEGEAPFHLEVITTTRPASETALHKWREVSGPPPSWAARPFERSDSLNPRQYDATVDGVPTNFNVWEGPTFWVAWSALTKPGVVILCQGGRPGPDGIRLRRVPDVEPLLQARGAALRAIRGGT